MAINVTIAKHTFAFPSKTLASDYGAHIYNVRVSADTDNGRIIRKGDWESFDLYKQSTTSASTMTAIIRDKANASDRWYVEIVANPDHELFVYKEPLSSEDYTNNYKDVANFYNVSGSVVRAYDLVAGDIIEISKEGFSGTPAKGKSLTISSGKFAVGA